MSGAFLMSDCLKLFIVQAVISSTDELFLSAERVVKGLKFLQTAGSLFKFYPVMYLFVLTELKFKFGIYKAKFFLYWYLYLYL